MVLSTPVTIMRLAIIKTMCNLNTGLLGHDIMHSW